MNVHVFIDGEIQLSQDQTKQLWILGTSGTDKAASALSSLINTTISISIPDIFMVHLNNLQNYLDDSISAVVLFKIQGQVRGDGYLVLIVPKPSILKLAAIMLGQPENERNLDEMDMSMLTEIGNIMTSSFLDAFASLLSLIMLPSPPSIVIDMPHAILASMIASLELEFSFDEVLIFKTDMHCQEHNLKAQILLVPSKNLLEELLDRFTSMEKKRSDERSS